MISFATSQLKWTFIAGTAVGIGIGVQLGRQSVFLAMSMTRNIVAGRLRRRAKRGNWRGARSKTSARMITKMMPSMHTIGMSQPPDGGGSQHVF